MNKEEQDTSNDDQWKRSIAIRMDAFERQLTDNTTLTNEVHENTKALVDIFKSWQGAMKVLEFLGKVAKPLAAIGAFLALYFTFGPKK
jgi:hypothetical protein